MMKKVNYLFERSELLNMDHHSLIAFKESYFKLLTDNPFPVPPKEGSFYEMILYFKRKDEKCPIKIGAYENITPFEAANRIASDLVIINGLLQLIDTDKNFEKAKFSLYLGTTHIKGKGDFIIHTENEDMHGEGFNVAPSFLKQKMRSTLNKWTNTVSPLRYILINAEGFEFIGNYKVDERIFRVENWELN